MSLGIAIYGKGGIGKSTVSANLSCALSSRGRKVLLIGCDPKHDTTRQILSSDIRTVTDYIFSVPPSERRLEDVAVVGRNGIVCVEAGGPRPGVGCAGKGIVSMFQALETMDISFVGADVTVFDVLGDVVCGGFAVPMRATHSDAVYVVTSGEAMSLYAANNILRGTIGFEKGSGRVAGIIFNSKGGEGEADVVEEFSRAVRVPIVARIPRSDLFMRAERSRTAAFDMSPDSEEVSGFLHLADSILQEGGPRLFFPEPLTDGQVDSLLSEGRVDGYGAYRGSMAPPMVQSILAEDMRMYSPPPRVARGPVGGLFEAGKLMDMPVIIHAADACAVSLQECLSTYRMSRIPYPTGTGENLYCTSIGDGDAVFGADRSLERCLRSVLDSYRGPVMVMTGCLPSSIGDDIRGTVERVELSYPGSQVILVEANRTSAGADAHMEVIRALVNIIDLDVECDMSKVAVVDDSFAELNRGSNLAEFDSILLMLGVGRIPGLLEDSTVADLKGMGRAGMFVLGEARAPNDEIRGMLEPRGARFFPKPVPRGFSETIGWVEEMGRVRGMDVSGIVDGMNAEYRRCLEEAGALNGRRIALVPDWRPHAWIVDTLRDSGAEVVTVGSAAYNSRSDMVSALDSGGFDLVIGDPLVCQGFHGVRIPLPETSVSHTASMRLIRRCRNAIASDRTQVWRTWGRHQ